MFKDISADWTKVDGVNHPVRFNHVGMTCHICNKNQSGHKVEQDADEAVGLVLDDGKLIGLPHHPFTAYACCDCFRNIMGSMVNCGKRS